jgi:hypothetical protein
VLPVHVHVFASPGGTNSFDYFGLSDSDASRQANAERAQDLFDFRIVQDEGGGFQASDLDWQSSRAAHLRAKLTVKPYAEADQAFARCNIQTRLESFSIIRQNNNLEISSQEPLCKGAGCCGGGNPAAHLWVDPSTQQFAKTIAKYVVNARDSLAAISASECAPDCISRGIHIFVLGEILQPAGQPALAGLGW